MATLLEVWQGDRSIQFLIGLTASVIGGVFAVGDAFTLIQGLACSWQFLRHFCMGSDASVKQLPA